MPSRCGGIPHISCAQSRAIPTWTLDIISSSLCIWQALGLVFSRQSTDAFTIISVYFVVVALEPFAHGNLDTTSTFSLAGLFPCNAWLECSSSVPSCIGTKFLKFLVNGSSDPAVDSRPALWGDFHVLQHGGRVHSRCSDCMDQPSSLHLNLDSMFMSP